MGEKGQMEGGEVNRVDEAMGCLFFCWRELDGAYAIAWTVF